VAWSPLTYAHEIDHWRLGAAPGPEPEAALPDHLLAVRPIQVQGDSRVAALGRGWAVVGSLRLQDLPRLRVLEGPLEVYGDLELEDLPALGTLGTGLQVHGNLTLAGCPALTAWPGDLRVAGAIWMDRRPEGFRPGRADLAARIAAPWPGVQPRSVAITDYPPGALELAGRQAGP
jgi:hypothetical protein